MALPRGIARSVSSQAEGLLRSGSRFTKYDQIRQRHFWSNYNFVPDANGYIQSGSYDVFTTPAGQSGQGYLVALSELETNWKSANRVPDNQNIEIKEIGVSVYCQTTGVPPASTPDNTPPPEFYLKSFESHALVAITYLTNTVELGYVGDFPQSAGPMMGNYEPVLFNTDANLLGIAPLAATNGVLSKSEVVSTNGIAAPGLRRRFKIPILLGHGETFSFRFLIPRTFFVGTQAGDQEMTYVARLDFWATESFVEKS